MKKNKTKIDLTDRERQILSFLADGYSNEEIADFLNVSKRTVEGHRAKIMLKLNRHKISSLVKYALENALTSVDSHRTYQSQSQSKDAN
ncbi:MAG: response regulator transcription factor [Acidobacteria bacterium]|nr:response regulator transcription factor [Acidobacteriota bacterium]